MGVTHFQLFLWDLLLHQYNEKWEQSYQELLVFLEENGKCRVPQAQGIREWVNSQRKGMKLHMQGKKSCLNIEIIEKLSSIGFEWSFFDWDESFEQLLAFELQNEHCVAPCNQDNLGRWILNQRTCCWNWQCRKKCDIIDGEIKTLEGIGFEWGDYRSHE